MSHNDPTDNALAAIASILDSPPVIPRERARSAEEDRPATPPPLDPAPTEEAPSFAMPPPLEEASLAVPPPLESSPSHALPPPLEEEPAVAAPAEPPPPLVSAPPLEAQPPLEAHGYSKFGPGPMAAIRFKWTVREEQGDYYVDETIGENSTPMVLGPMNRDAAIKMVDDREAEARRRFEQLKSEMIGRAAAANLVRKDSGEA